MAISFSRNPTKDPPMSNVTARGKRAATFRYSLLLFFFGRLQPDQGPLLRAVLAEVDQHRRLRLGQVADACFVDGSLPPADGPGGALGFGVHGPVDRQVRVRHGTVVVAPK